LTIADNERIKDSLTENRWFRLAKEECLNSSHQTRFGAVIILKNGKYFSACNVEKSHPLIKKHYDFFAVSLHAELNALLRVNVVRHGHQINGSTFYLYREDRNGWLKPARPCVTCFSIMKDAGVRKCFHTMPDGYKLIYL
tara:strand:- start:49 stop:468 length:420 start_codon:yes stop_codon:yes gene_type:complete